jgi:hypothetical protein
MMMQYLWKQFVLVGGLRNPSLSHLPETVPAGAPESDKDYFTSLYRMFERSAEVRVCIRAGGVRVLGASTWKRRLVLQSCSVCSFLSAPFPTVVRSLWGVRLGCP